MFLGKKALKPYEKNLKNSKTTLKIHYTFIYCLKMKNFIAGPCLPVNFVGLRLGFDVPEQIAPLRRWCLSWISSKPIKSDFLMVHEGTILNLETF